MSTVAPPSAAGRVRRVGTRGLAGTGFLGYLSFAIIVVAALVAVFGPMVTPV